MDTDSSVGLADYLAIVKRRRWQLIIPAVLIFLVATLVAFLLPPVYESSATILIEQQEVPPELVRSTVTSYAAQRIQVISQRVMTTAKLGAIIERFNLYPEERRKMSLSSVVDEMREDVDLDMVDADVVDARGGRAGEATIAFTLAYQNASPQLAQKVTSELVSLYLNENLKTRREAARETADFLAGEAEKLAQKISKLEGQLATFKEDHPENLPEQTQLNLQLLRSADEQRRDNERAIRSLEEQKTYLQSQLALLNPYNTITGERALSPAERLQAMRAQYRVNAGRYSEDHPDQIALRRAMEAVRRELASGPAANKGPRGSTGVDNTGPVADADNPAYVQLRTQLQVLVAEERWRKEEGVRLTEKFAELQQRLADAPQIEREYRTLVRDHEGAVARFKEIKDKQLEAQLAETLEIESKGERFELIEPPNLPDQPRKPNRLAIVFLGFVFGLGGGVGNLALRESLDQSVRGIRGVQNTLGFSPLAVIPYITLDEEIAARRRRRRWLFALVVAVVVLAMLAVHLLIMPLDELWLRLLGRFGLAGGGTG